MARKSTSRTRSSSKSRKPKMRVVKHRGKPFMFQEYRTINRKNGTKYKGWTFVPVKRWPKSYQGMSKATIEKNFKAMQRKMQNARKNKSKSRSRSTTRSRSRSSSMSRKARKMSKSRSKGKRGKSRSRTRSRSRSARKYKPITKAQAELAFNKWYKDQARKGRFASAKGMRSSMTYDLNHRSKIVKDERYAKNPHKYDYPGVDVGNKKRRPLTGAALKAHKKKLRSKSRSKSRSRSRSSSRRTKPRRKAASKRKSTRSKSTRSKPKRKN